MEILKDKRAGLYVLQGTYTIGGHSFYHISGVYAKSDKDADRIFRKKLGKKAEVMKGVILRAS